MNWNELTPGKYYWVRHQKQQWVEAPADSIPRWSYVPIENEWFPTELCLYEYCGGGLSMFGSEEDYREYDKIEILREANVS